MLHFACCCKSSFSFQKIIKIMFFKFTFFHRDLKGIIARIHFTKWFTAFLRKKCKIWRSNWAFSNLCKICIWPSFWPKGKEIRKKKKVKWKRHPWFWNDHMYATLKAGASVSTIALLTFWNIMWLWASESSGVV